MDFLNSLPGAPDETLEIYKNNDDLLTSDQECFQSKVSMSYLSSYSSCYCFCLIVCLLIGMGIFMMKKKKPAVVF